MNTTVDNHSTIITSNVNDSHMNNSVITTENSNFTKPVSTTVSSLVDIAIFFNCVAFLCLLIFIIFALRKECKKKKQMEQDQRVVNMLQHSEERNRVENQLETEDSSDEYEVEDFLEMQLIQDSESRKNKTRNKQHVVGFYIPFEDPAKDIPTTL